MFNRMKNALYNAVGGIEALPASGASDSSGSSVNERILAKFRYTRPNFLQLNSDDEIQVSADHVIRPIIVPRDITKLPWNSGYAEAINAGKSARNEDQGAMYKGTLHKTIQTVLHTPGQLIKEPLLQETENKPTISETLETTQPTSESMTDPLQNELQNLSLESDKDLTSKDSSSTTNSGEKEVMLESIQDPIPVALSSSSNSIPEMETKTVNFEQTMPWIYFGLFDGHAGSGAAVVAANTLYKIIEEKLKAITDLLLPFNNSLLSHNIHRPSSPSNLPQYMYYQEKHISKDHLVIGALESAFWEMDQQIGRDKIMYRVTGGCTAVIVIFFYGKLYIANAGDSRAIYCSGTKAIPLSQDFTPETERDRIRYLGLLRPELLGSEFTHLEYVTRPIRKDLGKRMLYRDAYMSGWAYKNISVEDLRFPLIYGEGKRSRVLATIGVTRGFGDHDLKAQTTDLDIKPFLTPQPEVRILNLLEMDLTESDVLVMATDGLWDITSNETAASIVQKSLDHFPANDSQRYKYRYISAAQDLVMHARGKLKERKWRTTDNKAATIDDISVFVVPLKPYKEEFIQWRQSQPQVAPSVSQASAPGTSKSSVAH